MGELLTRKIADPKKVGDFLIINITDFRPGIDVPWSEEAAAAAAVTSTADAAITFEVASVDDEVAAAAIEAHVDKIAAQVGRMRGKRR